MPMSGFPAVASRSSSSAEIVVPPVALSLDVAVALARAASSLRRVAILSEALRSRLTACACRHATGPGSPYVT
jgi:hypothetical protein